MKSIKILLFACLMITACELPPPTPPSTPDNNATIAAGVAQGLTQTAISVAIAQTLAAGVVDAPLSNPTSIPPTIGMEAPTDVIPTNPPAATATVAAPITGAKPQVIFTIVPPKGSSDFVEGRVEGVDPSRYQIAIYIKVGGGWWTKPTFASPTTPISSDGIWSTAYATGGNDPYATTIVAYLIPIGYYPPAVSGDNALPLELEENAVAKAEATR